MQRGLLFEGGGDGDRFGNSVRSSAGEGRAAHGQGVQLVIRGRHGGDGDFRSVLHRVAGGKRAVGAGDGQRAVDRGLNGYGMQRGGLSRQRQVIKGVEAASDTAVVILDVGNERLGFRVVYL